MKKLYLILLLLGLVLLPREGEAYYEPEHSGLDALALLFLLSPVSFQQEMELDNQKFSSAFDININYAILAIGYNYNSRYHSSFYIGASLTSLLQIQYGYSFSDKTDLLRIRSEYPIGTLFTDDSQSFFFPISAGVFYENAYNDERRGKSFGISVGYSILRIYEEIFGPLSMH